MSTTAPDGVERRDWQTRPINLDAAAFVYVCPDWRGWRVTLWFVPTGFTEWCQTVRVCQTRWGGRRLARRWARRMAALGVPTLLDLSALQQASRSL